jgi:FkbM family methyltransferase
VVVDIGAYIGDTLSDYVRTFGKNSYKKYYCYEIVPANLELIQKNIESLRLKNVEVRAKGAAEKSGVLYLTGNEVSTVNKLSESGELAVPTVMIDEDIEGPVTLIKMDIEGSEANALQGCRQKILENHP